MNRRWSILCGVLLLGWLTYVLLPGSSPAPAPESASPQAVEAPDPPPAPEQAQEPARDERKARAHVDQLAHLEAERDVRIAMEGKRQEFLMDLRSARDAKWTEVIRTNWSAYQVLRQKAQHSHNQTAPCTICDGRGSMVFCVACGSTGNCVRCGGVGKIFDSTCPVCRGTGKCVLCGGSRKMPCLFCDDGLVYANGSPPPEHMPVPARAFWPGLVAPQPKPALTRIYGVFRLLTSAATVFQSPAAKR